MSEHPKNTALADPEVEIEVTPEMLEAGIKEFDYLDLDDALFDPGAFVRDIYKAMHSIATAEREQK